MSLRCLKDNNIISNVNVPIQVIIISIINITIRICLAQCKKMVGNVFLGVQLIFKVHCMVYR